MTGPIPTVPPRLAPALNAGCQCIWLDRDRLRTQLRQNLGDVGHLLEARPGMVSGSVVFVDPHEAASMDRTVRLVQLALASPAYRQHVQQRAPAIARLPRGTSGGVLGLDFHLSGPDPQLIEINTNPGGMLINLELARAVTGGCDCIADSLAGLASGNVPLDEVPLLVAAAFLAEWQAARGTAPLRSIAIVDDNPPGQFLYPEFLLFRRLFERAGWSAQICDATALVHRSGALEHDGQPIDLVYNRLTDFYFTDPRHAALHQAYVDGSAVITPHPAAHAHWADKRLLAWLRDRTLLEAAGLDDDDCAHLLRSIPPTEIVDQAAADDLWRRRKQLFFKPVDGYGGKAAYRGDKLTRTAFEHIMVNRYVAQAVANTSTRRVQLADGEADLRVDVRSYSNQGTTWLRTARLYRGQTTNFRTPGGGFAPVLVLRS